MCQLPSGGWVWEAGLGRIIPVPSGSSGFGCEEEEGLWDVVSGTRGVSPRTEPFLWH